jgi:hypothetical protein
MVRQETDRLIAGCSKQSVAYHNGCFPVGDVLRCMAEDLFPVRPNCSAFRPLCHYSGLSALLSPPTEFKNESGTSNDDDCNVCDGDDFDCNYNGNNCNSNDCNYDINDSGNNCNGINCNGNKDSDNGEDSDKNGKKATTAMKMALKAMGQGRRLGQ